jgi:glycosyltransferase involved in cell wall biosynthesis
MRVLYFHQHFSTPRGSAGTRSYEMARRLVDTGHSVTIVCGSYGIGHTGLEGPFVGGRRKGLVEGIEVIEFDLAYSNKDGAAKRILTFATFALKSSWIAVSEPADIVFASTTPLTAALPGIAAKWLRGRRFVFEVRDLWPELPKAMGVITNPVILNAMSLLEWMAYKSADRLIALSPGIAKGVSRFGARPGNVAMVPNGCDLEMFGAPVQSWRPEGVEADDFMAIFTGTHGPANGLHAVVDAAVELKRRGITGIRLVLVGDGKEKAELQRRAQAEGLAEFLVFHPSVPKTQLTGLMASADLGMQILANVPAFYYGTSPNKFFDYLAAGLPVLTNYPGWIADLVTSHGAGVVAAPNDAGAFVDALLHARELKVQGRLTRDPVRLLAKQFDRDLLAEQWIAFVTTGRLPNPG